MQPHSPIDGVDYTPNGIQRLIAELHRIREEAMAQAQWDVVVVLTHSIAIMNYTLALMGPIPYVITEANAVSAYPDPVNRIENNAMYGKGSVYGKALGSEETNGR